MNFKYTYYDQEQTLIEKVESYYFNRKHGEMKTYYRNGNLRMVGYYFDGIPVNHGVS